MTALFNRGAGTTFTVAPSADRLGRIRLRGVTAGHVGHGLTNFPIKRQFMHTEDDLLPISALQHLLFCERQMALIHLERLWVENRLTAEGRVLHKKTDGAKSETRDGVRITRSLPVHSFKLGLFGVCDVVNFTPPAFEPQPATSLPKRIEHELNRLTRPIGVVTETSQLGQVKRDEDNSPFHQWTITPVEYKRGQPKKNDADRVQLCAQAMCLEEMLRTSIPRGELFYGKQQRRTEVVLSDELRQLTVRAAERLQLLMFAGVTPKATREPKCENCSLLPVCMPSPSQSVNASVYLRNLIEE